MAGAGGAPAARPGDWARLRVGAAGLGAGLGCGVGVGWGWPLRLGAPPLLGSAAGGLGEGLARAAGALGLSPGGRGRRWAPAGFRAGGAAASASATVSSRRGWWPAQARSRTPVPGC